MNQQEIKQLLLTALTPLEQERIRIHKKIQQYKFWSGIALVAGIAFVVICMWLPNLFLGGGASTFSAFFVGIVFSMLGVYLYREHAAVEVQLLRNIWEEQVKTEVYAAVFEAWNPSVQYHPKKQVKEEHFEAANLHEGYAHYKGEDFCEGMLKDGRRFQFSEIGAQREVYPFNSEQDHIPNHATVFRGLFFVLENTLPYADFEGFLKIYPSLLEAPIVADRPVPIPQKKLEAKHYDHILDADFTPITSSKKVKNKEPLPSLFDSIYTVEEVGGEDELARASLPLPLTEQLGHLKSFFQQYLSVTFCNNKVYFSSRLPSDYLPVVVEHSLISEARLQHLVNSFWLTFLVLEKIAEATIAITPKEA